jgi:hypothetical protein
MNIRFKPDVFAGVFASRGRFSATPPENPATSPESSATPPENAATSPESSAIRPESGRRLRKDTNVWRKTGRVSRIWNDRRAAGTDVCG